MTTETKTETKTILLIDPKANSGEAFVQAIKGENGSNEEGTGKISGIEKVVKKIETYKNLPELKILRAANPEQVINMLTNGAHQIDAIVIGNGMRLASSHELSASTLVSGLSQFVTSCPPIIAVFDNLGDVEEAKKNSVFRNAGVKCVPTSRGIFEIYHDIHKAMGKHPSQSQAVGVTR